mgnify:CR=1 FL=1
MYKKYKTLFPLKQCLFFRSGKLYFFIVLYLQVYQIIHHII